MSDQPSMRLRNAEDLLAAMPFLLGFAPEDSLIIMTIVERRVPSLVRVALPDPGELPAPLCQVLNLSAARIGKQAGAHTLLVGYGPADRVEHTVQAAADALRTARVPIDLALRVTGDRYWYLDGVPGPMPGSPDGIPIDASDTAIAAQAVYAGLVALPNRDALAATLAPVTGPAREGMVAATKAACTRYVAQVDAAAEPGHKPRLGTDTPVGRQLHAEALRRLHRVENRYRRAAAVTDDDVAALTILLDLPDIRGVAAYRTGRQGWQLAMWTDVVRRAEPLFRTTPAVLLTLCALQAGDGALANLALDRALTDDPNDRMARLLSEAIGAGIDPATIASILDH